MKPSDIIPGQRYRNRLIPGVEYLGVKKFNKDTESDNFELILVILTEDNFRFGHTVCPPEYCGKGYWEEFYAVDKICRI